MAIQVLSYGFQPLHYHKILKQDLLFVEFDTRLKFRDSRKPRPFPLFLNCGEPLVRTETDGC